MAKRRIDNRKFLLTHLNIKKKTIHILSIQNSKLTVDAPASTAVGQESVQELSRPTAVEKVKLSHSVQPSISCAPPIALLYLPAGHSVQVVRASAYFPIPQNVHLSVKAS